MSQIIYPAASLSGGGSSSSSPAVASRIVYASTAAALDVDLATGLQRGTGSSATDDTAAISNALSLATSTAPVRYVLDGAALCSGIVTPIGHIVIEGVGFESGVFQRAGSNTDMLRNFAAGFSQFDPGSAGYPMWQGSTTLTAFTLPTRSGTFAIRNLRLEGNRGSGSNGNSSTGNTRGLAMNSNPSTNEWFCGIRHDNLLHGIYENIWFTNISAYCLRLSNIGSALVHGCRFEPVTAATGNNTDGVHINGNGSDIRILGNYFSTGDDSVALNSTEGYPGPIVRVAIIGNTFNGSQTAMRAYYNDRVTATPAQAGSVDDVVFSDNSGTMIETCYLIGFEEMYPRSNLNGIGTLRFSGNRLAAPSLAQIMTNCDTLLFSDETWTPTQGTPLGMFHFTMSGCTVGNLTLNNCRIKRSGVGSRAAALLDFAGVSAYYGAGADSGTGAHVVNTVTINGVGVEDQAGSSYANVPYLINMNANSIIKRLVINSLDSSKFGAFINNAAYLPQIQNISGPGVLATGWEFPDATMANGTAYLSATSHLPSIKIAGVVKTYSFS